MGNSILLNWLGGEKKKTPAAGLETRPTIHQRKRNDWRSVGKIYVRNLWGSGRKTPITGKTPRMSGGIGRL